MRAANEHHMDSPSMKRASAESQSEYEFSKILNTALDCKPRGISCWTPPRLVAECNRERMRTQCQDRDCSSPKNKVFFIDVSVESSLPFEYFQYTTKGSNAALVLFPRLSLWRSKASCPCQYKTTGQRRFLKGMDGSNPSRMRDGRVLGQRQTLFTRVRHQ